MATYYTSNGDDNVYHYWVTGTTSNTTTTAVDYAWNNWNNISPTATTTGDAWYTWVSDSTAQKAFDYREDYIYGRWVAEPHEPVLEEARVIKTYPTIFISPQVPSPNKPSEQVRAEKVQRIINAAWRDYQIEEERKRKERVELTAQNLLLDLIGEKEFAIYKETGRLVVHGRRFDYIIRKSGGVYKIERGKIVDLCIHLNNRHAYPASDNVIGLKLMIEANEWAFNRTANNHGEIYDEKRKQEMLTLVNEHRKLVHKKDMQDEEVQAAVL